VKFQLAVTLEANVVGLELIFRDNYEAAVWHDDMVERLQSGGGLRLSLVAPRQSGIHEKIDG
jgi:hypothetical protein